MCLDLPGKARQVGRDRNEAHAREVTTSGDGMPLTDSAVATGESEGRGDLIAGAG
jgi:hypothetical protein